MSLSDGATGTPPAQRQDPQKRPPALAFRLRRAFDRDQQEALELAAKVRVIALLPVLIWLLTFSASTGPEFWWLFASAAVFLPTSLLHFLAARNHDRHFIVTYALFAIDVAVLGFFLAFPNPFSTPTLTAAASLNAGPFFWFLFFLLNAAFSANWRLVIWTGSWVFIVRALQLLWVLSQPDTLTEAEYDVSTSSGWLTAIADPNFVFLTEGIGNLVGIASFTVATAFLVWRGRRTLERQIIAERARAQISRYVSSSVLDQVMAEEQQFASARQAVVGVLFVDVVGFTRLVESLPPNQTILFLRELHTRLAEAVFAHHGAIDKFLGDGLMASFGATSPSESPHPAAANALAAGLDMVAAIDRWNREREAAGARPIRIGVGIDYGPATVGDVGDERRLEFTVVGDIVNVAARVEELTRSLATPILATGRTMTAARKTEDGTKLAARFESLGAQRIRGRRQPVTVFGLIDSAATQ